MSARGLRSLLIVLAMTGLGVASYLTYVHYAGVMPVCTIGGSCEKVQTSVYAEFAGMPVALIGLLGYVAILALLVCAQSETTRFTAMTFVLIGFAFSAYLTYREVYSIHAICEWCAFSAMILTVMAPLSVWRFLQGPVSGSRSANPVQSPNGDGRSRVPAGP
jgi:uncharacterized membrane protein